MGIIKKGVLDGFSGKIGTVIGSSWNGIPYMRFSPKTIKNPRTKQQTSHRVKFSMAINYLKPLKEVIRVGWRQYAVKQSAFNAATSYLYANAIIGDYPDFSIDPNKVLISRGTLSSETNASVTYASGTITFKWNVNSGSSNDLALLVVVNPSGCDAIFNVGKSNRKEGKQSICLPATWMGEIVDAFLGFASENSQKVENSIYLGSVTVV